MKNRRINALQLSCLRGALRTAHGAILCDRSTGKALVARGLAVEKRDYFFITDAGRQRAKFKADYAGETTAGIVERDPILMQDLPEEPAKCQCHD